MLKHSKFFIEKNAKRYRRQLILKEIGIEGQMLLAKSKVVIIGAGGLGSPAALYLAAAGVGKIGIVDSDIVDISNLQRQILYSNKDVGKYKVTSAQKKLQGLNPEIEAIGYKKRVSAKNINNIINGYDLVINAVDNLETRYLVNDACLSNQIPLIEGAIYHFEGYVMTIIPGVSACYRCLFPYDSKSNREEIGVIGVIPGVIGTLQAMEALKYLLNLGQLLKDTIIYYNALETKFHKVNIEKNPNCIACSSKVKNLIPK
jgi:molybdopterin-synthase adenylyltransferase